MKGVKPMQIFEFKEDKIIFLNDRQIKSLFIQNILGEKVFLEFSYKKGLITVDIESLDKTTITSGEYNIYYETFNDEVLELSNIKGDTFLLNHLDYIFTDENFNIVTLENNKILKKDAIKNGILLFNIPTYDKFEVLFTDELTFKIKIFDIPKVYISEIQKGVIYFASPDDFCLVLKDSKTAKEIEIIIDKKDDLSFLDLAKVSNVSFDNHKYIAYFRIGNSTKKYLFTSEESTYRSLNKYNIVTKNRVQTLDISIGEEGLVFLFSEVLMKTWWDTSLNIELDNFINSNIEFVRVLASNEKEVGVTIKNFENKTQYCLRLDEEFYTSETFSLLYRDINLGKYFNLKIKDNRSMFYGPELYFKNYYIDLNKKYFEVKNNPTLAITSYFSKIIVKNNEKKIYHQEKSKEVKSTFSFSFWKKKRKENNDCNQKQEDESRKKLYVEIHGEIYELANYSINQGILVIDSFLSQTFLLLKNSFKKYKISTPVFYFDDDNKRKKFLFIRSPELVMNQYKDAQIYLTINKEKELIIRTNNVKGNIKPEELEVYHSTFSNKEIWLVGENQGHIKKENGFVFFEWLMDRKSKEINPYLIIDNDSKNLIKKYPKNTIIKDSDIHHKILKRADRLVVTHSVMDVSASCGYFNKPVFYLQHGVVAMKKIQYNRNSYAGNLKKFMVSSQKEANYLINQNKFYESQIEVTGLSRLDLLEQKVRSEKIKNIVFFPTWRDWIKEPAYNELFIYQLTEFLNDPNLEKLLVSKQCKLTVVFHDFFLQNLNYNLQDFFSRENSNIVFENGEKISELIKTSDLLITDYSSVVWDFVYQGKGVLLFQSDIQEYHEHRGSYIDMEDVFGELISYNSTDLLEKLLRVISEENDNFLYKNIDRLRSEFFDHIDKNNSERVYDAIISTDLNE